MILNLISIPLFCIFLAGAVGAFVSDVLQDNSIILPKRIGNVLNLGFCGSVIIGGIAGLLIDGSLITAFMGGYMGKSIIKNLVEKSPPGGIGGNFLAVES